MKRIGMIVLLFFPIALLYFQDAVNPCASLFREYLLDYASIIVVLCGTFIMLLLSGNAKAFFLGIRIYFSKRLSYTEEELWNAMIAIKQSMIYVVLLSTAMSVHSFIVGLDSCYNYAGRMDEIVFANRDLILNILVVFAVSASDYLRLCFVILCIFPFYAYLSKLYRSS